MFKNTIRKQVMKVIDQRISDVQEAHDAEQEQLEQKHNDEISRLIDEHQQTKESITAHHVNSILSKIL